MDNKRKLITSVRLAPVISWLLFPLHASAVQITENVHAHILAAASYQAVQAGNDDDPDGTAVPVQVGLEWRLDDKNSLYTRLGFARGDGVNLSSPFNIDSWGADLESDVTNINGTSRNYLLTAWYRHTFFSDDDQHFDLAAGLIDGTDYLDRNILSNNEYTQFMNAMLVNAPNVFIPSYNPGIALIWGKGAFSTRFAYMNLNENNDGNEGHYAAMEIDYSVHNHLGPGMYRVTLAHTDKSYFDTSGNGMTSRRAMVFSFDQQVASGVGIFTRFGMQDDTAFIDYESILSGGVQIRGIRWKRPRDTVGIGMGTLQGGNSGIKRSRVFESYYRFALSRNFDATLDAQYMSDVYQDASDDVSGWVLGVRGLAHF